jgi:hypothetical protein
MPWESNTRLQRDAFALYFTVVMDAWDSRKLACLSCSQSDPESWELVKSLLQACSSQQTSDWLMGSLVAEN